MEKGVADVTNCKTVILDEADKLLSQDFQGLKSHTNKWDRGNAVGGVCLLNENGSIFL